MHLCSKVAALCVIVLVPVTASAQLRLQRVDPGSVSARDLQLLSDPQTLNDLGCRVAVVKPAIGLDLRFHSGYSVTAQLHSIAGRAAEISTLVRVTPVAQPDRKVFLARSIAVPQLDSATSGEAEFQGEYAVGPGRYSVDWLTAGGALACSAHWEIEAKDDPSLDGAPLAIAADTADELPADPFYPSRDRLPAATHSFNVKLLVNFSAPAPDHGSMSSDDLRGITAILRGLAREPRFGRFALVAFSIDQQRVVYRRPADTRIDFPALGRSVRSLQFGTVPLQQLAEPESTENFLTGLLQKELGSRSEPPPDAIIVVSPTMPEDNGIRNRISSAQFRVSCPIFYLTYNPDPVNYPWRGGLAMAAKALHALEFTITGPKDLTSALRKMVASMSTPR
jgi:hypothetical protein